MANTHKDIVITTNKSINTANDVPNIRFAGGDSASNINIYLYVYTTSNGQLSFEGSAGQLFSITNDLGNTIFSVSDLSGIPSMEINADGRIVLTEFGGNVGIGTNSPKHKLDVNAGINANSYIIISGLNVAPTLTAAFIYANGVNTNTFTALSTSIAGFDKANLAYTFAANNAFGVGNAAFASGNTTWTYASNVVMSAANAAFSMANAANLIPVGNTMANGYYNVRSTKRQLNFIPGTNITINVDDDPTLNTSNITITSSASGGDPADAFGRANIANLQPVGNTMSNGYFSVRSTKNKINFIPGTNISINVDEDATLNTANITITASAGSDPAAPFAYDKANAANIVAESAFIYANGVNTNTFSTMAIAIAAYSQANTDWTYAANNVMLAANAAFSQANGANIIPVGNTMANGYYTIRSSKRQLNFIPGSVWDVINVDTDATLNTSNITITTNLAGAFTQANLAWDKANLAYTFAANNAHLTANSAYAAANLAYTFAANNAFLVGNSAFAFANGVNANTFTALSTAIESFGYANGVNTNTFTSMATAIASFGYANGVNTNTFTALATAIAAYTLANTTWTYAANNVMLVANNAYNKANAANSIAEAGLIHANSAYVLANTTWTYAANNVMLVANSAFAMANAANLMPVGNTMANSYWTVRSTKRRLNFIPGTNITINVDDDPTLNTANIIIAASISGGDPSDAFGRANIANLVPVGNTMSNGYFTIRSTKNKINFIPGTNITINVDDDPALNTANITITSTATGTGGGAAVSAVPPGSPTANDLWWSSETGKLYVYYNDGSSSQWVDASPGEVIANGAAEIAVAAFTKANTTNVRSAAPLNITVSTTAPTGNSVGDIWIDTN